MGNNEAKTYFADLSVLQGLERPRRSDGHRAETWEQARVRFEHLPEPQRSERLKQLEEWQGGEL
jgi:NurA-like 5'-3' nuclease